jgi:N-terminal acetyltransferase B complex non-catalytic subunit
MDNFNGILQHENKELKMELHRKKERIDKLRDKIEAYVAREHELEDERMSLVIDLKERDDFAQKVVRERNKCQAEIKELKDIIENKNKENVEREMIISKEKEIKANIVKEFTDENAGILKDIAKLEKKKEQTEKEKEKMEKDCNEQKEEVFRLKGIIHKIQTNIEEKEATLVKVESEKEGLEMRLYVMKEENEELKEIIEKNDNSKANSLSKELGYLWEHNDSLEFEENVVEKNVKNDVLKDALIKEENELKERICHQKIKLNEDLLKLNIKECEERSFCQCRGYCRVFHNKHNWYKSKSKELMEEMKSQRIYQCDQCEIKFSRLKALSQHNKTEHRVRRLEAGEV